MSAHSALVRVQLPFHLRTLARLASDATEVEVLVAPPVTPAAILEALEERYPVLRGTIRDYGTLRRRAWLRFFACGQDISHEPMDTRLPEAVAAGAEPFIVMGAIAGG